MAHFARGDEVISTLLDEIVSLKGWDPSSIFPDNRLGSDLELSDAEITLLAKRLSDRFLLSGQFDCSEWREMSLQEIVSLIRSCYVQAA